MKQIWRIVLLVLLISAGTTVTNKTLSQPASVSFSVFYNSLKPYGRWVNNPTYGQIWISNEPSFIPYSTGGHWAYTDYGWTWVSDYDWGWAPFHYGRWAYDPGEGWFWVPGYEWAPAWVAWRNSNDYYGWAPLSPGLTIGVNVSFNSIAANLWTFAPQRYITSPYISRYYVPHSRNVTIIKNTTIVNNVTVRNNVHYVAGPRKQDVERASHTTIKTYAVANAARPGKTVVNNNTINIYKPVVNNNKTVLNKNTTVNKNSNNTTVNKNSNNINTNKATSNNNKTTVNNNSTTNKLAAPKQTAAKRQQQQKTAGSNPNVNNANTVNKPNNNQQNKPATIKNQQVTPKKSVSKTAPQKKATSNTTKKKAQPHNNNKKQ